MSGTALPIIEGQYFRDLMEQPTALDATLGSLRAADRWKNVLRLVQSRRWTRVVLTGMGSSYHTLQPLYWSLIAGGFNPVLIETSELIHYGRALCDEDALIVLVSQSGASAETVRLLELQSRSPILGVTNTANSPLARRADLAILVQAGTEFSVSCKTYVGGMLCLQWLAAIFRRGTGPAVSAGLASACRGPGRSVARRSPPVPGGTGRFPGGGRHRRVDHQGIGPFSCRRHEQRRAAARAAGDAAGRHADRGLQRR